MLTRLRIAGFTLIELLVGLSIGVLLLLLAIPAYNRWIADAQTLDGAETVAAGLRYAYAEAIKRNTNIEFTFDKTVGTGGWTVQLAGGALLRRDKLAAGSDLTVFAVSPATSTTVTFNALGLVEAANAAAPLVPFNSIDVSNPNGTRPLRVVVGNPNNPKTGIKICDPSLPDPWPKDPRACP